MAAARLIVRLDAPHYIMENVVGVLKAPEWMEAASFLSDAGYESRDLLVNANDCGVPQRRHRVFVVGSRTAGTAAIGGSGGKCGGMGIRGTRYS